MSHEPSPAAAALLALNIQRRLRSKARWLARQHGFVRSDVDDLAQEFALRLLQSAPGYDPTRQPATAFAALVIRRHTGKLLAQARAACRNPAQTELWPHETAATPIIDRRRAAETFGTLDDVERQIDLAAILDGLDPELRAFADALAEHGFAGAVLRLGLTRRDAEPRSPKRWTARVSPKFRVQGAQSRAAAGN